MKTENIHYAHMKFKLFCQIIIQAQLRNTHERHQKRMTRLPSPLRQTVSKYVHCDLSESRIRTRLFKLASTLINLVNYEGHKN